MNSIKVFLTDMAKKSEGFRYLLRKGMYYRDCMRYRRYASMPIHENRVVFESFLGRKYVDSPKAIYEAMLKNPKYKDFEYIWFFREPEKYKFLEKNPNTKVATFNTPEYFKYYATSKYWVTNSHLKESISKREGQIYLQCWHGTPLKKLGCDIEVKDGNAMNSLREIHSKYQIDSKRYDYMISPSKFCTEKFASSFYLTALHKEDCLIETGYPRNDAIALATKERQDEIRKSLNLPADKKVILYAPTWRDNQHDPKIGYTYKTEVDFDKLREDIGDEYIVLFRAHYFVASSFDFGKYEGFVYDVCNYDDINDLYIAADLLITDYSSVFFDYSILKRPMIFYMYDLKEYQEELRDFYIDIHELPGPIVENQEDLTKAIFDSVHFTYDEKYEKFNQKFTYLDDGHAAERVIDIMMK